MKITTDVKNNVAYIELLPAEKGVWSVEVGKDAVADFTDTGELVGIEVLDATAYKPADFQALVSLARAEAQKISRSPGEEREPPDDLEDGADSDLEADFDE
jgi:uncharacterized protein YuzE